MEVLRELDAAYVSASGDFSSQLPHALSAIRLVKTLHKGSQVNLDALSALVDLSSRYKIAESGLRNRRIDLIAKRIAVAHMRCELERASFTRPVSSSAKAIQSAYGGKPVK